VTVSTSNAPRVKAHPAADVRRKTSADILVLPSRIEMDCRTNMAAVVERARLLQVFGPNVDFDASVWDISASKEPRPTSSSVRRLYFMTRGRGRANQDGREEMARGFADLIRTIVVMREFSQPAGSHAKIIDASRALYEACRNRDHDPAELTSQDFENAARLIARRTKRSTAYYLTNALVDIADFLNKHALTKAIISFRNPFPRDELGSRIDDQAKARRTDRMPSEDLVDAIIAMSSAVTEDADILRARIVDLLFCAPWRINEVLNLGVDCVRTEKATDRGEPVLDAAGQQVVNFGLAYGGSKGFPDSIKPVPSAMVDVAKKAIEDIIRITQPTRDVAKWMAAHPGRAWLPEPWRLADPDTEVLTRDLVPLLGVSVPAAGLLTLKNWKVKPIDRRQIPGQSGVPASIFRLGDIESAILALQPKLPSNAPWPLEEYLFLVPMHFFHPKRVGFQSIVSFATDRNMRAFLGGASNIKSVFERLELYDEHGKRYSLRSHAVRHYLNTMAQEGGASQLDIARWSGRKSLHQNSAYDHMSGMALAEKVREVLETNGMTGSVVETANRLPPAKREEFLKARFSTAHSTDIGMCFSDWTIAPCHKHGACADCGDHLVIKGDAKQKTRAELMLSEQKAMLADAEKETSEETYGASNFVEHNRKVVTGLEKVLGIHNDASIPDGTLVHPTDQKE
jgi:hypothetical protein